MNGRGCRGLLVSQIGYESGRPAKIFWRDEVGVEPPPLAVDGVSSKWSPQGQIWGSQWWEANVEDHGLPRRQVEAGGFVELVEFGRNVLWEKTWRAVSYEGLSRRALIAKNGRGWLDCGSHWQEANSHACCLLGLLDLLEFAGGSLADDEKAAVSQQIRIGLDLLAWYQDMAGEFPGGEGAVIHEMPEHRNQLVPSDASKAAAVFARAARLLGTPDEALKWRSRAEAACAWLVSASPSGSYGFSAEAHGVAAGTPVPDEFMTRDLLMELWAVLELARGSRVPPRGEHLVRQILARQFRSLPEGIEYPGQFATFAGWLRPEPAWTHFLAKESVGNDVGATVPHWLVPLMRFVEWWPDNPLATEARAAVERFAYGYFLPACRSNPFLILPLGEFPGEGLIWFAGLWHGMNSTYGWAAVLALEFESFFNDPAFRSVAEGNLQWIAGLNSGIYPGVETGCELSTPQTEPGRFLPVSMIYGIGRRFFGSWKTIRGSIGSGFCTGRSFRFDVPPRKAFDAPTSFADEDWITFNGAWLSAIARMQS